MSDEQHELFSHSATILQVPNVLEAAEFYRDIYGFSINFLWEDPPSYAVLKRGDVGIHFALYDGEITHKPDTSLYIFVHDVDKVHDELVRSGANITNPIGNRDYGMRDFDCTDPNGYTLCFAKSSE